jgi:uncharacterized membrane-anchored protein
METEIEELQKKNNEIRDTIRDIIEEWSGDKAEIFILINELIENEIEQEKFCGE